MGSKRSDYDRSKYTHRSSNSQNVPEERRRAQARSRSQAVQRSQSQRGRQAQQGLHTQRAAHTQRTGSAQHTRRPASAQTCNHPTNGARRTATPQLSRQSAHPAYAGSYSLSHEKVIKAREQRNKRVLIGGIVAAIILIAAISFIFFPPVYTVTINGVGKTVRGGATLQTLIDEGYVSPKAGNLIAVDGSVAAEGKGEPFVADVNGQKTSDPSYGLFPGANIEMTNGGDKEESYKETKQTLPHAKSDTTATQASYYFGSVHLYSDGEDGEQSVRTGDVSGKTATVVTKQPIDSGFTAYTPNTGGDKVVALTFDDGPWPNSTAEILKILEENDAHATFFMIGNQVSENADIVKKLQAAGNQLATHTYDHAAGSGQGVNLTYMSESEQINEVTKGISSIEDVTGTKISHILRAPGGNYYGSLVETLHPYITAEIGWDVDTEDWRRPGSDVIAQRIESVKPGEIILCHDGGGDRSQTVEAIRTAIPALKAQGYKFVTVDELLAYGVPASK